MRAYNKTIQILHFVKFVHCRFAGSNKSARACQVGQGQVQEEEVFKGVNPTLKPIYMVVLFDMNRVIWWMLPIVKFEKKSRTGPCGPHGCEEEKRQRKSGREPRVEVKVGKGFYQRFLAMG